MGVGGFVWKWEMWELAIVSCRIADWVGLYGNGGGSGIKTKAAAKTLRAQRRGVLMGWGLGEAGAWALGWLDCGGTAATIIEAPFPELG